MTKFRGDQEKLFRLCSDLKWKQTTLSKLLGIAPQTLSRYWTLQRELPEHLFIKILEEVIGDAKKSDLCLEDRIRILEERLGGKAA